MRWLLAWIPLVFLMIGNGILRESGYGYPVASPGPVSSRAGRLSVTGEGPAAQRRGMDLMNAPPPDTTAPYTLPAASTATPSGFESLG